MSLLEHTGTAKYTFKNTEDIWTHARNLILAHFA